MLLRGSAWTQYFLQRMIAFEKCKASAIYKGDHAGLPHALPDPKYFRHMKNPTREQRQTFWVHYCENDRDCSKKDVKEGESDLVSGDNAGTPLLEISEMSDESESLITVHDRRSSIRNFK
jgi:hypothetical protein